jgi:lipopolysaccharide heptosyltransferase II
MSVLILKLGATGDVVRTTTLLRRLNGPVTWITAEKNKPLLQNIGRDVRSLSWENRALAADVSYDLVINLEDEPEVSAFLRRVKHDRVFGAFLDHKDQIQYTDDSHHWFDLSLISRHGRKKADQLKLANRSTYQELLFGGMGFAFFAEKYFLPPSVPTGLEGDVALSPVAGPVWPMKAWACYPELQRELEARGLKVNVLPTRPSLLEHLADVRGHRVVVSGDSLPMHLALGSGVRCVSIFTCTSPWEIHDYGLQVKLVSPLLGEFFYKRGFDPRATTAVGLDEVLAAVLAQLI